VINIFHICSSVGLVKWTELSFNTRTYGFFRANKVLGKQMFRAFHEDLKFLH